MLNYVACVAPRDRPQVLDYIYLTSEVQKLAKQVSDWERKLEIAQMEEKRTQKMLRTLTQGVQRVSMTSNAAPEFQQ